MDTAQAQHLITRIQALIDQRQGAELSRLELDLVKSYVVKLYDALCTAGDAGTVHTPGVESTYRQENVARPEPPVVDTEPEYDEDPVFIRLPDPPKPRWTQEQDPVTITPSEAPTSEREFDPQQEPEREPNEFRKEPEPIAAYESVSDDLLALFDPPAHSGLQPVGNVVSQDILDNLGLNDRIFTLNDLFGGDRGLFENTIQVLNGFGTFSEAKAHLLHGVARTLDWADPERVKKAQEFIRIVRRRYPQNS